MHSTVLPIPRDTILVGFTTNHNLPARPQIAHVPISKDSALGVHKVNNPKILLHPTVHVHDRDAWEALYPKGSINPTGVVKGGFGFYLAGPKAFADAMAAGAREAVVGYEMLFEDGFQWAKGGKLPGVYGGIGDSAYSCTGGRKEDRCRCFNLRLMWRANGVGELYAYLPLTEANAQRLRAVPGSHENSDYGFSLGRGVWKFEPGRWMAVAIRAKLNDVGSQNGEIEVFVDGQSVLRVDGVALCDDAAARIRGGHFQTFFGGHTQEWASPRDQKVWFASISGAVLRPNARDEL
ncbi:hypothetical protein BC834DRAFT_884177 [Gloeopeniophorella convolvens]|nr:hypothetical protein BC834DRAFT_884177 [Gloeopeniophorella convolvens]